MLVTPGLCLPSLNCWILAYDIGFAPFDRISSLIGLAHMLSGAGALAAYALVASVVLTLELGLALNTEILTVRIAL